MLPLGAVTEYVLAGFANCTVFRDGKMICRDKGSGSWPRLIGSMTLPVPTEGIASAVIHGSDVCVLLSADRTRRCTEPLAFTAGDSPWRWRQVTTTGQRISFLTDDGELISYPPLPEPPPRQRFVDARTWGYFACGIDAAGTITCWGTTTDAHPPPGKAVMFAHSTGSGFCILYADGTPWCYRKYADPPAHLRFKDLAAVSGGACGVTLDNKVACWGDRYVVEVPEDLRAE